RSTRGDGETVGRLAWPAFSLPVTGGGRCRPRPRSARRSPRFAASVLGRDRVVLLLGLLELLGLRDRPIARPRADAEDLVLAADGHPAARAFGVGADGDLLL